MYALIKSGTSSERIPLICSRCAMNQHFPTFNMSNFSGALDLPPSLNLVVCEAANRSVIAALCKDIRVRCGDSVAAGARCDHAAIVSTVCQSLKPSGRRDQRTIALNRWLLFLRALTG